MKRVFQNTKTGEMKYIDDETLEYEEFEKTRKDEWEEWFFFHGDT